MDWKSSYGIEHAPKTFPQLILIHRTLRTWNRFRYPSQSSQAISGSSETIETAGSAPLRALRFYAIVINFFIWTSTVTEWWHCRERAEPSLRLLPLGLPVVAMLPIEWDIRDDSSQDLNWAFYEHKLFDLIMSNWKAQWQSSEFGKSLICNLARINHSLISNRAFVGPWHSQ
jgi:hypothetical protein